MDPIVQVSGLRRTYGTTVAVDEVSFEVGEGKIFSCGRSERGRQDHSMVTFRWE